MIAAIAHHPTVHPGGGDAIAQIVRLAPLGRTVHGILIVVVLALFYAMTVFSMRQGLQFDRVIAALIAYAFATAAFIAAAVIDGFVIPDISQYAVDGSAQTRAVGFDLLNVCSMAVQAITWIAVAAASVALSLWSSGLLRVRGLSRALGALGIAAALLPWIVFGVTTRLTPVTLEVITLGECVWYLGVASALARNVL